MTTYTAMCLIVAWVASCAACYFWGNVMALKQQIRTIEWMQREFCEYVETEQEAPDAR